MDKQRRIQKLEAQLQRIAHELNGLRREEAQPETHRAEPPPSHGAPGHVMRFSAVAVVFLMAIAIAALVRSEGAAPWHKIVAGYSVALGCIVYGWLSRTRHHPFSQFLLGAGLAALYFSSLAVFSPHDVKAVAQRSVVLPLVATCAVLFIIAAHGRRSRIAASIGLLFIYYTVVAGCIHRPTEASLLYALVTCTALSASVFLFNAFHRWRTFAWLGMLATYSIAFLFFRTQPHAMRFPQLDYFWLSISLTAFCFIAYACTCMLDARRSGEYVRSVTSLGILNSLLFLAWAWGPVRTNYPGSEWGFLLGYAVTLWVFAACAERLGAPRGMFAQWHAVLGLALALLALLHMLPGAKVWPSLALICLMLTILHGYTAIPLFKALSLVLLAITTAACLPEASLPGRMFLAGHNFPTAWFSIGGAAALFLVCGWIYEHIPSSAAYSGGPTRWFLADSWLDVRPATASVLFAGASALVLAALTVFRYADSPTLPYLLAIEASAFASMGLVLGMRPLYAASIALLLAGHTTFQFFLWLHYANLESQPDFVTQAGLLAGLTYAAGVLWERFLERVDAPRGVGHYALASVPCLVATLLLAVMGVRELPPEQIPPALCLLSMALIFAGWALHGAGPVAGGLFALALGTASFFNYIGALERRLFEEPQYLLYLALLITSYIASERLLWLIERRAPSSARMDDLLRTILVATAGSVGILAINRWAPEPYLSPLWFGLGGVLLGLGFTCRESRYKWAAVFVLAVASARVIFYDLDDWPLPVQILAFIMLLVFVLALVRAYLKARAHRAHHAAIARNSGPPSHG